MRLIDADALSKPHYAEDDNVTGVGMTYAEIDGYNDGIDAMWGRIERAQTVCDVEVVRCKDCIHFGLYDCPMCYIEKQELIFINHDPDFYCRYGERKENG